MSPADGAGVTAQLLTGPLLPPRLADLEQPPQTLYLRGQLPRGAGVAIVGKRHPTEPARRYARMLAGVLARQGVCVWSGGAEGIDTAAHEGALDVGGTTVVVAPAGWERPFPFANRRLFEHVLEAGGAYLSAMPCDQPATQASFFPRNAILVALAQVVVVVEAGYRSGALNAAKWARRLGRSLLVVPSTPWTPEGAGCLVELKRGAKPLTHEKDVLQELRALRAHPMAPFRSSVQASLDLSARGPAVAPPTSPRQRVMAALEAGATHADAIVQETGLTAAEVQELILTLTLDGVLAPDPSGGLKFVSRQYR